MPAVLTALLFAAVSGPVEVPPAWLEPTLPAEVPSQMPADRPEPPTDRPSEPTAGHRKNYVLSALETGMILGTGTVWFWSNSAQTETWDLHFDWSSWKRKIDFSAVRFDADRFETNASSHPRAGTYYFQVARGNGLSYAQAYLWGFTASVLWEYLIEWNENPSINDMILTPASGAPLGESTFRIGRFFDAGMPTLANRVGAVLFSPFAVIDDLAVGRRRAAEGPYDELGFTQAIGHKFVLAIDQLACIVDGTRSDQASVGLVTEVVSYRGYRRPGNLTVTVGPGLWTELAARLFVADRKGVEGLDLHSSTLLVGRYLRHYAEPESDEPSRQQRPRGWGLMYGLGSAFDYESRQLGRGLDKVASAGLAGPMAELVAERGGVGLRVALSSYYSFAMVESIAYLANGAPLTSLEINTTLRNQGYYYAHGVTSVGSVLLKLGDLELSFVANLGAFWSLNGRDRYQERLQKDLSAHDTRTSGVAEAGVRPFGGPVLIAGRVEHLERFGRLDGDSSASSVETRAGLGAGVVF